MIEKTIRYCAEHKFIVFLGTLFLTAAGIWSIRNTPLDAIPDLSDVQVKSTNVSSTQPLILV